ncbi:MAG: M50 family metallopeptidase [Kiritimatiellae bacterium]|nr:M50 family metallopeptidase [Kiritimatiellia bacterium]
MLLFNNRFRLTELFGIPIYVDVSFAFLMLMFVISSSSLQYGMTEAILLAFSVIAHEFGHSLTARAFGYQTTDITISLLGGCASLIALPRKAWQELLTALAGPLVSFLLSALGFAALFLLPIENHWLEFSLWYLGWMNLMLGGFNLLPGFPLDGGRIFRSVLRAFLSRPKATFVAMWVGRAFAILLGLSGLHAIINGGGWGGVRLLIAWMIWTEGYREYQMALMESNWTYEDYRARVSPPPYGGDGDDCDVTRD